MNSKCALVITSIAKADNRVLQTFAKDCPQHDVEFIVIGDKPSPLNFNLEGCNFYGLEAQRNLDFSFAKLVPERHYSRKNIGYLQAIKNGAEIIIETDDDNFPRENFGVTGKKIIRSLRLTGMTGLMCTSTSAVVLYGPEVIPWSKFKRKFLI